MYRSPEIYDLENRDYRDDLAFYRELCRKAKGPILELGCGTGRLTIPLARSSIPVTGLDASPGMLSLARRKARSEKVRIHWVRADMSRFRLGRRFAAAILPLNSIQHLIRDEQIRGLMLCLLRHLRPGGLFAFDVYNPRTRVLRRKRAYPVWRYHSPQGFVDVWVRNRCPGRRINHVRFEHRRGGVMVFEEEMTLRCFFPGELRGLLEGSGFDVSGWYGGFDRRPFRPDSPLQVVVARLGSGL